MVLKRRALLLSTGKVKIFRATTSVTGYQSLRS